MGRPGLPGPCWGRLGFRELKNEAGSVVGSPCREEQALPGWVSDSAGNWLFSAASFSSPKNPPSRGCPGARGRQRGLCLVPKRVSPLAALRS